MAKIIKTVRSNWKKSVVGAVAVVYGINYGIDKYRIEKLMRLYCEEAVKYGEVPVPPNLKPRNVTVILNPAANRRKAKSNFEKYCAPLLHLAGFSVDVLLTESEGQARNLAADLKDTDVIIVAGGDGTLSETVTGLMRKRGAVQSPLAVLPLGRTNSVASALLGSPEGPASAADLAASAMAVVRGNTKRLDAFRVDLIQVEEGESPKPVYGLSGIKWGVYRDLLSRQDRYWYLGVLRGYAAVLFNSLGLQPVSAHIAYTHACDGCNRCYQERLDLQSVNSSRWYHYLMPSFTHRKTPEAAVHIDYRRVVNTQCGLTSEKDITGIDINVSCPCVCPGSRGMSVSTGPESLGWSEFVKEGWRRVNGELPSNLQLLEAQSLELVPTAFIENKLLEGEEEKFFSIDNEDYEVRSIRVTLLPKAIQVFNPQQATSYTLLERALLGCC